MGFGRRTPTIDHYIPLSKGGSRHSENKVLACARCNKKKGDMLPEDFINGSYLKRRKQQIRERRPNGS